MLIEKIKKNKGFVILYAVTLAAIILSVTLGISEIALKENIFSTSAKDSNAAFFAADTGLECALNYDKSTSANNAFTGGASFVGPMVCAGSNITVSGGGNQWNFIVSKLGDPASPQGCANVTVTKTYNNGNVFSTTVVSLGYNTGGSVAGSCNPTATTVERELDSNYSNY